MGNMCKITHVVGKTEGKRPLGRPRRRWEGNVKVDLKERYCENMDWIELVHINVQ
jgi:hypothetical protein